MASVASNLEKLFEAIWLLRTFGIENFQGIVLFHVGYREWFRAAYTVHPAQDCIIHCGECTAVWSLSRQGKYDCTPSGKFSWCYLHFCTKCGQELARGFAFPTWVNWRSFDDVIALFNTQVHFRGSIIILIFILCLKPCGTWIHF